MATGDALRGIYFPVEVEDLKERIEAYLQVYNEMKGGDEVRL
jgi:hypothetical protein